MLLNDLSKSQKELDFFKGTSSRLVARHRDETERWLVSTVHVGCDPFGLHEGFETCIFDNEGSGSQESEVVQVYDDEEAALDGHEYWRTVLEMMEEPRIEKLIEMGTFQTNQLKKLTTEELAEKVLTGLAAVSKLMKKG